MTDNLSTASVFVDTLPEERRRGYGSQMLALLEARATEWGRTIVQSEVTWPIDAVEWSGSAFLLAHGYQLGIEDRQRRLPLPAVGLEALAAAAAPHHTDYRLVSWTDPTPDQYAQDLADLESIIGVESPTGSMSHEVASSDLGRFRALERVRAVQGRLRYVTVAFDAAGQMAGYTEIVTSQHEPELCFQWGTLVRGGDRGHRLGVALKVANLLAVQSARPDLKSILTYNATSNTHMVAVNEALGFRVVGAGGEFEKRLS